MTKKIFNFQFSIFKNSRSGFVLLFAVTIASILLAIALGVSNIALKEVKFGTSVRNSNNAFFAADSGAEYALYNEKTSNSSYPDGMITGPFVVASSSGVSCVTVNKTVSTVTTITSKGYDSNNVSCNSSNSDRTERELKITYNTVTTRAPAGGGGGGGGGGCDPNDNLCNCLANGGSAEECDCNNTPGMEWYDGACVTNEEACNYSGGCWDYNSCHDCCDGTSPDQCVQ